jgi:hypothetical protein
MAIINTQNTRQVIDYQARDYDSFRQALVDLIPAKLPEWTDRSEADFGIVLIELTAYVADILSYYQDRIANEAFLATAQERRSVIQHLRLIGYELAGAAPAAGRLSLLVANTQNGLAEIRPGDQFATVSSKQQNSVTFEYTDDKPLVIDLAGLPASQFQPGMKEALSAIPVREGKTIFREVIGVSDGTPNQRFILAQPKVLRNTVQIIADTDPPTPPWQFRKNLIFSGRAFTPLQLAALEYQDRIASTLGFSRDTDPDFMLETDENEVTTVIFGDGQYGMIPPVGARLLATYRIGGGAFGNVGAGQITVITNAPQLQRLGAKVINRVAASGGADRESIDQAVRFAPSVFTSMNRAVTAEDYRAQALLFPGVSKARAVAESWNTIVLFVAPEGQGEEPSDILRRDLLAYFEDKRMLTCQIHIQGPMYVSLVIKLEIGAKPYFHNVDVQNAAATAIRTLFSFDNVNFGDKLYLSKVYEAVESLAGVDFVNVTEFRLSNDVNPIVPTGRIVLYDDQIPVLAPADLVIDVNGGVSGAPA